MGSKLWNSQPTWLQRDNDFALRQYNKFLRDSRQALLSGAKAPRLALIICLLVIRIENLQWHFMQGLSNIYRGVQLFDSLVLTEGPITKRKVSSSIAEDETVQRFRMLEVEANMLFDPFPTSHYRILNSEDEARTSQMPHSFTSIEEAKHYLDLLAHQARHFIVAARPMKPSLWKLDRETIHTDLLAPVRKCKFNNPSPFPIPADPNLYTSLSIHVHSLFTWKRSFRPLISTTTPSSTNYLPALLLSIHAEAQTINLLTAFSTTQLIYDSHLSSFQEIVTQSRSFLNHPESKPFLSYVADSALSGLIGPLRLVAEKCRHRALRREAISLLCSRPWREGIWWSCSGAQLSAWLMLVEEAGVSDDEPGVPEWTRVRLLEVEIWEEGSVTTLKAVCVRENGKFEFGEWVWMVGGEEGKFVFRDQGGGPAEIAGEGFGDEGGL